MLNVSGKNIVKKGDVIFEKGEELNQIGIILSGKVVMQGEYVKMIRTQGSYLALNGYKDQTYHATYIALEDSVIYALPTQGNRQSGILFRKMRTIVQLWFLRSLG